MCDALDQRWSKERLLWREIKPRLAPAEKNEVKRVLGREVIRKNKALMQEVLALQDMLQQFREQNDDELEKVASSVRFISRKPGQDLLKRQIILLIEKLHLGDQVTYYGVGSLGLPSCAACVISLRPPTKALPKGGQR